MKETTTFNREDVLINTKTNGQQLYIISTGLTLELNEDKSKVLYAFIAKFCPFVNKQSLAGDLVLTYDDKVGYSFTVDYSNY